MAGLELADCLDTASISSRRSEGEILVLGSLAVEKAEGEHSTHECNRLVSRG